ncbi:hypothetical protein D9M68_826820 [compost metagenome]
MAAAAADGVIAIAAKDDVVAVIAEELVVAVPANDVIVAEAAGDTVIAGAGVDDVIAGEGIDIVVPRGAGMDVVIWSQGDGIADNIETGGLDGGEQAIADLVREGDGAEHAGQRGEGPAIAHLNQSATGGGDGVDGEGIAIGISRAEEQLGETDEHDLAGKDIVKPHRTENGRGAVGVG